jgi:hypothetical protein
MPAFLKSRFQFSARELLLAAVSIDIDRLSRDDAAAVLEYRVAIRTALGNYDSGMGTDVTLLLESFSDKISPDHIAALGCSAVAVAVSCNPWRLNASSVPHCHVNQEDGGGQR